MNGQFVIYRRGLQRGIARAKPELIRSFLQELNEAVIEFFHQQLNLFKLLTNEPKGDVSFTDVFAI